MPNEAPLSIAFSRDARYWMLVALPKSQLLAVTPSLTPLPLKPPTPADTHQSGSSVVKTLGGRRICASSDSAAHINTNNAKKKRLIFLLQVVLRFARCVG
jgi:hypothetical protein